MPQGNQTKCGRLVFLNLWANVEHCGFIFSDVMLACVYLPDVDCYKWNYSGFHQILLIPLGFPVPHVGYYASFQNHEHEIYLWNKNKRQHRLIVAFSPQSVFLLQIQDIWSFIF